MAAPRAVPGQHQVPGGNGLPVSPGLDAVRTTQTRLLSILPGSREHGLTEPDNARRAMPLDALRCAGRSRHGTLPTLEPGVDHPRVDGRWRVGRACAIHGPEEPPRWRRGKGDRGWRLTPPPSGGRRKPPTSRSEDALLRSGVDADAGSLGVACMELRAGDLRVSWNGGVRSNRIRGHLGVCEVQHGTRGAPRAPGLPGRPLGCSEPARTPHFGAAEQTAGSYDGIRAKSVRATSVAGNPRMTCRPPFGGREPGSRTRLRSRRERGDQRRARLESVRPGASAPGRPPRPHDAGSFGRRAAVGGWRIRRTAGAPRGSSRRELSSDGA